MTIRKHILNNFKNDNYESIKSAITESIDSADEVTLPGLGVFFELLWQESNQELKNTIIDNIKTGIRKGLENI